MRSFVVDSVELVALDQAKEMWHLDRCHPAGRQHHPHPADEVVEVGNMGHDVVGDQKVARRPSAASWLASSRPKNSTTVSMPSSRPTRATLAAGSIPSAGIPRPRTCWSK